MRKIIDRIKELNEVLPEVFLVDLLYLLAGELVIWFLVPNKQMCAVGFFMGVVYSIFSSVHIDSLSMYLSFYSLNILNQ